LNSKIPNADRLVVRWTIGDVRPRGFEMLRISIACAQRLFGPSAHYTVCVNTIGVREAQDKCGLSSRAVEWRQVDRASSPEVLREFCRPDLMEGMGWKLIPLRLYPERYELAIDNDCIIWDLPAGMRDWLENPEACLSARDVERSLGSFDSMCPPGAMNAGIRGLPPGTDLEDTLTDVLEELRSRDNSASLISEIEEQGLQVAAMCRMDPLYLVETDEVTICSPFWPRSPHLGRCGAHFVGMNSSHIPWDYYGKPADLWLDEHWNKMRPLLLERAGLS
jgi:hypothetical protein